MGGELGARLMQVQLLVAEPQGNAPVAEILSPHAEHLIEPNGRVDVLDRQDKVIERTNPHANHRLGGSQAEDARQLRNAATSSSSASGETDSRGM